MKIMYLVLVVAILLGVTLPSSGTAVESKSLRLQGKVLRVKRTVQEAGYLFDLDLELELVNVGERPIILLRGAYHTGEWWLLNTVLYLEPGNSQSVLYYGGTSPANSQSMSQWGKLRAQLSRPTPPKNLTYVIAPGEKVVFHQSTFVIVSGSDLKTLRRKHWLQVQLEMWPFNIENGFDRRDFLNLLTKRWAKEGVLWGDIIISEPIEVSFQQ